MGYREATCAERERFLNIAEKASGLCGDVEIDEKKGRIIRRTTLFGNTNIGGLSEKALHLALKYFYEENEDFHEVYINGFYADIMRDGEIIEVQTKNFVSFRKKIDTLSRDFPVMIVHPVRKDNKIVTIDGETGEEIRRKISPHHENIYSVFKKLVYLRDFLPRDTISLSFPVVTTLDRRISLAGARKPIKADIYPTDLLGFYEFDTPYALSSLLPEIEGEYLLVKDLAKKLSITHDTAGAMANVMLRLGILKKDGKEGRAIKYIYGKNY